MRQLYVPFDLDKGTALLRSPEATLVGLNLRHIHLDCFSLSDMLVDSVSKRWIGLTFQYLLDPSADDRVVASPAHSRAILFSGNSDRSRKRGLELDASSWCIDVLWQDTPPELIEERWTQSSSQVWLCQMNDTRPQRLSDIVGLLVADIDLHLMYANQPDVWFDYSNRDSP